MLKDQRIYQGTLFAAIDQSNLIGVLFVVWLGRAAPETPPVPAALVFVLWVAASWCVWLWVRKPFWPGDWGSERPPWKLTDCVGRGRLGASLAAAPPAATE